MPTLNPNISVNADDTLSSSGLNNLNFLQPTSFQLSIDRRHFSNLQFFCQTVLHPSLNTNAIEVPYQRISTVPFSGDKLTFTELTCIIIVDENLKGSFSQLSKSIKHDLRMTRGIKKESSNLNKIQKKTGSKIGHRNSKLYQKILYRNDRFEINIRGKVDGIIDDCIVESKNRTSRLFNTLRPYERVQLEGYMYLTGLTKCILTEHYDDTSNTIHCIHDKMFWMKCVERIIAFIETHIAVNI